MRNGERPRRNFAFIKKVNFLTGFTLTEVILTILIVGILAAVSLPRLGGRDFFIQLKARTEAHQIAADIRYARQLAITYSKDCAIQFDFNNRTYDIILGGTSIDREFPKDVPPEITLSGTNQFTFQRLGNATPGSIMCSSGGNSYSIAVESITGAVVMEKVH